MVIVNRTFDCLVCSVCFSVDKVQSLNLSLVSHIIRLWLERVKIKGRRDYRMPSK